MSGNMVSMVENRADFKKNQIFDRIRGCALREADLVTADGEGQAGGQAEADGRQQADNVRIAAGFFETWTWLP